MKRSSLVAVLFAVVALAGCERISKPYIMTVDRVDQEVNGGNKGYLQGNPPASQEKVDRKRPLIAVDMDLVTIKGARNKEDGIK